MSDFDVLGTVGKLALPTFARFWICGNPSLGLRDTDPRTEAAGVFLVRLRTVFRSGFRLRPGKILAIREFHVVHECVFFPTCPGSRINLLRVRKTLCASVATSVQALHRGKLGFARYNLANGGHWNVPYTTRSFSDRDFGLTGGALDDPEVARFLAITPSFLIRFRPVKYRIEALSVLHALVRGWAVRFNLRSGQRSGQTWSTLVKPGQNSPDSGKCTLRRASRIKPPIGWSRSRLLLAIASNNQAYLGGNVCAKILSDPLQLGPRAKTLRQEVHFSYHVQLSDRQELLRSSRNLSQKMTPWHKEHSNGLCSQDHILRTQARLCARPVPLENRVFLTRNKLIREPGHVGKKTHSCTTWNSRIAKNFTGSSRNPDRKNVPPNGPKTPRWPLFAGPYLTSPSSDSREIQEPCKSRQRKLSDGTKNVEIRHRELGQICARTGTRFEKKRAGSKTRSRLRAQVFPARKS
uniref:Uncharacterized protein n=1 Tax=Fagus sylvatica TaxID=28930 RepID=A0A2N9GHT9_FAGSY